MQDQQQFEQLIMLYTQLRNSANEISKMINNEDYDSAITMIKNRENVFLTCKCIRKYLELTPAQEVELKELLDDLKSIEKQNIDKLQAGISEVKAELKEIQQKQKINDVYKNIHDKDLKSSWDIKE